MLDLIKKVTGNGAVAVEYIYYPDGTIKRIKNGSLCTEYTYDADKNLSRLKTMLGTEVLVDNHYAYDHNGSRTEKRQLSGNTRYAYDSMNRLTKAEYLAYTEELFYDRAGNRTRRNAKGVEELYHYDARNRLTEYTKGGKTTAFTYDNAGNLIKDDNAKYTYDAFNRTTKVETFDGHVQINRYDAEGLRHELEEDGKLVQFIFHDEEVIAEKTDSSIIRFIRGYDLIASDAESARTYYHYASDEMSSITHVVEGTDVLNHYEYDAWGNTTVCEETVENRFRFNGQQYDPVSQQYYLRARFYNPVIARFTQEDTYRGDGLNLYAYCKNNPVYYVDPSGQYSDCIKDAYKAERKRLEDEYRKKYNISKNQPLDEQVINKFKKDAYAYAKRIYEQNRRNQAADKQKQIADRAKIESKLMDLVSKAKNHTLTKAEYKQLSYYSQLLGAGDSLAFGDDRNPLIKAQHNRYEADKMRGTLPKSQRGLTKRGKNRTVASDGTDYTVSGYSGKRMGKKHLNKFNTNIDFNQIIKKARLAGYIMPTNSSKDNGNPGYEAASHAEKQMYSTGSNIIGVTLGMCKGCQTYFTHISGYDRDNIYISDPSNQHIFTSTGLHFILK